MICETRFRWSASALTHVGLVRQVNEDACLDLTERCLWAVADGMGGHARGDVASRMVIDALNSIPEHENLADLAAAVRLQLQEVNRRLRIEAAMRDAQIIGSTVVVLIACGSMCSFLWAGDSRLYLYRNGLLRQLSRDHSQVEELLSSGQLSAEEAQRHPARNLITRAVGAADTLELEEDCIETCDGDMFLLCSDGISNEVEEHEICSALVCGSCRQSAEALIALALHGGGRDNISAVVVRADDMQSPEKTVLNPAL